MVIETQQDLMIEVKDLVTHYGDIKILDKIDFAVRKKEIHVIMGGSGSGKSTLLRHMLGLDTPTSGCIKIFGQDITKITPVDMHGLRQKIGVSFQAGALFNSMTVADNVAFPLREHTELDENTIGIMTRMKLEVVNLSGYDDFMPAQLSGGMIKRAALARAIEMDPRLLFFDEPSAGLDPVVSADLDQLILRLRDAMNITIVVVTHELESAFAIADKITVLDEGRILMTGTVDEVKHSKIERVENLLNRKADEHIVDPDAYLDRLTQEIRSS